jgi:hypothetical protein
MALLICSYCLCLNFIILSDVAGKSESNMIGGSMIEALLLIGSAAVVAGLLIFGFYMLLTGLYL